METLVERYKNIIAGVLICSDRLVLSGTLPVLCNQQTMTNYLYSKEIRIFDYAKFCEPYKLKLKVRTAKEYSNIDQRVLKLELNSELLISEPILEHLINDL